MRRLVLILLMLVLAAVPVKAMEFTAPEAPESSQELMLAQTESFGEGVLKILRDALSALQPQILTAAKTCASLMGIVMLVSVIQTIPGHSSRVTELTAAVAVSAVLLRQTTAMVRTAAETVMELSAYGKLLLPVMTTAMVAGGGTTSASVLYTGTVFFDAVLGAAAGDLLVPLVYIYLALSVAAGATGIDRLKKVKDFVKWLTTWGLKLILYIFTGYIGITGVVSGATDAAAVKAAKLTLSGMVPVVGGILSDASEAVLVGAGVMKNAAGIYGLLAIIAIVIAPFFQIGIQYLMLKLTAAVCSAFDSKRTTELIESFSSAMGLLLGMTGTMCVMLLVSTACFMKGVA